MARIRLILYTSKHLSRASFPAARYFGRKRWHPLDDWFRCLVQALLGSYIVEGCWLFGEATSADAETFFFRSSVRERFVATSSYTDSRSANALRRRLAKCSLRKTALTLAAPALPNDCAC